MKTLLEVFELILILTMVFSGVILLPIFFFHLLGVLLGAS